MNELQLDDRTRSWLLYGMGAAVLDGLLEIVGTVLALRTWGHTGFTPDAAVGLVAIVPQAVVLVAYLRLARGVHSRSMWKAGLGMFLGLWLSQPLFLIMSEVISGGGTTLTLIAVAIGLLGLFGFLLSRRPHFPPPSNPADVTRAGGNFSEPVGEPKAVVEAETTTEPTSSGRGGWGVFGGGFIAFLVIKAVLKIGGRGVLRNIPLDGDAWAIIELLALLLAVVIFGIWFAAAKIGLRERLGTTAALVGGWELLAIVLHVAMVVAMLVGVVSIYMANPNIGDVEVEKHIDPWLQSVEVVAAASYVLWALLTAALFAAVRQRSEPDWREAMMPR